MMGLRRGDACDSRNSHVNHSRESQLYSATPREAAAQDQRQQEKRDQLRTPGVVVGGRNSFNCRGRS